MDHFLSREQTVVSPVGQVFEYFATPLNLDAMTPPSLRIRVLTPPPYDMAVNTTYAYAMRLRGIPLRWTSVITRFEPPYRFTYRQLHGPYAFWEHDHLYSESDGRTTIRDEVRYALPIGGVGRFLNEIFVRHELNRIFDWRARSIAVYFAAGCSERGAASVSAGRASVDTKTSSGGVVRP